MAVGNSYAPDVVSGRCDAFIGQVMLGDGKGNFTGTDVNHSGFFVDGDAKSIVQLTSGDNILTIVGQNNDSLRVFARAPSRNVKQLKVNKNEVSAMLTLRDGKQQRMETGYGTSYLSQSSQNVPVTKEIKQVILFDAVGNRTRIIDY